MTEEPLSRDAAKLTPSGGAWSGVMTPDQISQVSDLEWVESVHLSGKP